MGSDNQSLKLPVINFSAKLKPNTTEWESVRTQVQKALQEFGCFEASFKDLHLASLKSGFFGSVQEFFNLPLETKKLNVSTKPFQSFVNGHEDSKNLPYEAVSIDNANILKDVESFTNVSWPQGNPGFCKTIKAYADELSELDMTIRKMIFESFGIEKYLKKHLDSTNYTLRLTKYEDPKNSGTTQGLQAHTDKGLINILSQNQVNGLEVQTKEGQWILVKPSSSSSVVILGEVFSSVLTNGRLHSPVHRVMINGNQPRYSAGLFCNAKDDYLIKTPKEMVDEKYPLAFKPFYYEAYIKFFSTDGLEMASPLKTYCGV